MADQNNIADVRLLIYVLITLFCVDLSHSTIVRYNTDELHPNPVRKISFSGEPHTLFDRWRRSSSSDPAESDTEGDADGNFKKLSFVVNKLEGTSKHKEAYMHWSGNKSNVSIVKMLYSKCQL